MPQGRGRFITFEGLDGTGKSTQLNLLSDFLRQHGVEVASTREPGGTPIGERVRSILLNSRTAGLSPMAELGLMFADRAQHVEQVILPALKQGQFVLCDRYTDSSEAYQGFGRGLGSEAVLSLHKLLCCDLWPDLTIFLQSDLQASVNRARSRNLGNVNRGEGDENRFEKEDIQFYKRVEAGYRQIAKREARRVVVVSAAGPIESTHSHIVKLIEQRFPEVAETMHPAARSKRPQAAGSKH
jgi:dTMP kinase